MSDQAQSLLNRIAAAGADADPALFEQFGAAIAEAGPSTGVPVVAPTRPKPFVPASQRDND